MKKGIVQAWVDEHVDLDELKDTIKRRFESGDVGYNEEKTEKGVFAQTIITDAYTRWVDVELAYQYGFITRELYDFYYDNDLYAVSFEEEFKVFQRAVCDYLKEKLNLPGTFTIDWAEPFSRNTENYYGICYRETV